MSELQKTRTSCPLEVGCMVLLAIVGWSSIITGCQAPKASMAASESSKKVKKKMVKVSAKAVGPWRSDHPPQIHGLHGSTCSHLGETRIVRVTHDETIGGWIDPSHPWWNLSPVWQGGCCTQFVQTCRFKKFWLGCTSCFAKRQTIMNMFSSLLLQVNGPHPSIHPSILLHIWGGWNCEGAEVNCRKFSGWRGLPIFELAFFHKNLFVIFYE